MKLATWPRPRCGNCRLFGHRWRECPFPKRTTFRRTVRVPGTNVALLSRPSKMPCPSWSLPAGPACPFMVTGENTICGECYATFGKYAADPAVRNAQQTRYQWTRECMRTPEGVDSFVATMIGAIRGTGYKWMRVHDSGDLFSPTYTRAWQRICTELHEVRFWFPTRSWQAPWLAVIQELAALPNVAVRPSALHFHDAPPVVPGLAAGTTVKERGQSCPAANNGNRCGDCRKCWVAQDEPVSYHKAARTRERLPLLELVP